MPSTQSVKKFFTVQTVSKGCQHFTLSTPIPDRELAGVLSIPPDIRHLVGVDVDQKSNKDWADPLVKHFAEHQAVEGEVKRLGHICCAGEHLTAIPKVEINRFKGCPMPKMQILECNV